MLHFMKTLRMTFKIRQKNEANKFMLSEKEKKIVP